MNISKRLPNCSPKWVDHGNSALDGQFSKGMLHLVGLSWGYWRIPWILEIDATLSIAKAVLSTFSWHMNYLKKCTSTGLTGLSVNNDI